MPQRVSSVEGPDWVERVSRADKIIARLEQGNWNFEKAREVFAKNARADVLGKEIVNIFDGQHITRYGTLIVGGVGEAFNLIGHFPATAIFRVNDLGIMREVKDALGSEGLGTLPRYAEMGKPQKIEFYNYTIFYKLEELIRYFLVNESGCFPSTLEHLKRLFASGNVVQGSQYMPAVPSNDPKRPAIMQVDGLVMAFPSKTMEWMERPLYGGLDQTTVHKEYLLTPKKTKIAHPFLELQREGRVVLYGRAWHVREFGGSVHKDGIRDDVVPEESEK